MRNNTFLNLRVMLRNELGRSTNVAVGVDDVDRLNNQLNWAYEQIYSMNDWPHMRKTSSPVTLAAGQRYYDFPTDMDYDRLEGVWAWWSGLPMPLKRGIGFEQYTAYDSTNDVRVDPPLRWDPRFIGTAITTNNLQFEIWPIPATDGVPVLFVGLRKLAKLVSDADVCALDDWLVVKYAAAGLEKDKARAQMRRQEFGERYTELTSNMHTGTEAVKPNGPGCAPNEELFKNTVIVVR